MGRTGFKVLKWSCWPIQVAFGVLGVATTFIYAMHEGIDWFVATTAFSSWVVLLGSLFGWWTDLTLEGTYKGDFTSRVKINIKWGFYLFILSEIFFFLAFFSSWFYYGVGENSLFLLGSWPPEGIEVAYPWSIPAVNTVLLLSSGVTVTFCHHYVKDLVLLKDNLFSPAGTIALDDPDWTDEIEDAQAMLAKQHFKASATLAATIFLGVVFMYLQSIEYRWASITFSDSTYGGMFFLLTGFHGMHVTVGLIFLGVCWFRLQWNHFAHKDCHLGLDCAIAYWHFVDGVWLGVFASVYLWPYHCLQ